MIIDFECDMPTAAVKKETEALLKSGGGFVHRGYFKLFGKAWAAMMGMGLEEFNELVQQKGYIEAALMILEKTIEKPLTDEEYIQMMDDAGVTVGCIGTNGMWSSVEDRAAIAQKYPDRLMPFIEVAPTKG